MQQGAAENIGVESPRRRHEAETWRLDLLTPCERPGAERFIRAAFRKAYSARIATFMPQLAGLYRGSELLGACGLRPAGDGPLFLEAYLDRAVELSLAAVTRSAVRRSAICEVGNLAIARPGAARMLIELLTAHLLEQRTEWVVFTAVPALRNNFLRLRIPLHVLAPARAEHLDAGARQQWGRYYECSPQVSAVRVADSAAALRANS